MIDFGFQLFLDRFTQYTPISVSQYYITSTRAPSSSCFGSFGSGFEPRPSRSDPSSIASCSSFPPKPKLLVLLYLLLLSLLLL